MWKCCPALILKKNEQKSAATLASISSNFPLIFGGLSAAAQFLPTFITAKRKLIGNGIPELCKWKKALLLEPRLQTQGRSRTIQDVNARKLWKRKHVWRCIQMHARRRPRRRSPVTLTPSGLLTRLRRFRCNLPPIDPLPVPLFSEMSKSSDFTVPPLEAGAVAPKVNWSFSRWVPSPAPPPNQSRDFGSRRALLTANQPSLSNANGLSATDNVER